MLAGDGRVTRAIVASEVDVDVDERAGLRW